MSYLSLTILFACFPEKTLEETGGMDTGDHADTADQEEDSGQSSAIAAPVVFAASDVDQSAIDRTLEWFDVAANAWFTEDTFGAEQNLYSPVYLVMTGDDMQATIDLEQEYCAHLNQYHTDTVEYSRCNYSDPNCEQGICLFTEYVTNGGAGIASSRQNDGYHLMIMAAKNPSPEEEDYKRIVLHEVFHIFQLSQHAETDYAIAEEIQGRRTGDHDENVPWWMEGVAEYMSIVLYAEQDGVDANYIEQQFRYKIGYYDNNAGTPIIDDYFDLDIKLYNIKFDENAMFGYTLGAWFVAYLMNDYGEEKLHSFYQNIRNESFEENFINHFEQPYRAYVDEFEVFLQQDPEQLLTILP